MWCLPLYICTPQIISRVRPWFFSTNFLENRFQKCFLALQFVFFAFLWVSNSVNPFSLASLTTSENFTPGLGISEIHAVSTTESFQISQKKMKFQSTLNISKHLLSQSLYRKKYPKEQKRMLDSESNPLPGVEDKWQSSAENALNLMSLFWWSTLQATQISCKLPDFFGTHHLRSNLFYIFTWLLAVSTSSSARTKAWSGPITGSPAPTLELDIRSQKFPTCHAPCPKVPAVAS